ncbi:DNA-directed RNA polymerase sigma-70 factor [Streptomyces sp. NPDC051597]|uniref:DNA-directed RNA polymerase sigma-70 factor n=1 Tax=Streptomyces sp. NPDC051597 TaxID=3155049 RepID=UPI0034170D59
MSLKRHSTRRPRSAAKRAAKPPASAPVRHDPAHDPGHVHDPAQVHDPAHAHGPAHVHGPAPAPFPSPAGEATLRAEQAGGTPPRATLPGALVEGPAPQGPLKEAPAGGDHPAPSSAEAGKDPGKGAGPDSGADPDTEPAPGTEAETETGTAPGDEAEAEAEADPGSTGHPHPLFDTAGEAFDALYAALSTPLAHQAYLLTGRRRLAKEAVERAFHLAWQHWPEVATDPDPAGWVRAAAHQYALSPWHRFRPAHRRPDRPPADRGLRRLLRSLLELPPAYRRTLLLYDGLGLDLPETAAETQASTPATANRVLHAREAVAFRVPELAAAATPEALSALLRRRLGDLVLAQPEGVVKLPGPRRVRTGGERRIRVWTRAAVSLTAVIVGATAFTLSTAPTRYIPPVSPGQRIGNVPLNSGPQRQGEVDVELHRKLLEEPVHGPERLVPEFR